MSAPVNDGGPAFPIADYDHQTFEPQTIDEMRRLLSGMSLRDYFAARALPAVIERTWFDFDYEPKPGLNVIENHAVLVYELADAMMKARAS